MQERRCASVASVKGTNLPSSAFERGLESNCPSPRRSGCGVERSIGKTGCARFRTLEVPIGQCKVWKFPPPVPPIGSKNSQGRRPRMEDAGTIWHNLVEVPIRFRPEDRVVPEALEKGLLPLFNDEAPSSPRTPLARFPSEHSEDELRITRSKASPTESSQQERVESSFHFAGVFDGHGGQLVSREIANRLHVLLVDAFVQIAVLSRCVASNGNTSSDGSASFQRSTSSNPLVGSVSLKRKLSRGLCSDSNGLNIGDSVPSPTHKTARKTGEEGYVSSSCSSAGLSGSCFKEGRTSPVLLNHRGIGLKQIAEALRLAFRWMDDELYKREEAKNIGSTAVVALVSKTHLCVANCGDSRAVLSRAGMAYRMTRDHKPEIDDEQERITNCGGKVLEFNGKRVMGLLAMSRALGDHCLRDVGVIADPEVTIVGRRQQDEFLILASDGLWDALSDEEVCDLARRCFNRAKERGAEADTASRVAASVLMRAALDRGSSDNITVTVIDLHHENQVHM